MKKLLRYNIFYFKKIYKFAVDCFFIGVISFIDRKRFHKNQKFNFLDKIYEILKKCYVIKNFISKRSITLALTIFS